MPNWSKFTTEELERRRSESRAAFEEMQRDEFDRWYQEKCDQDYWTRGQCCAGCDHWHSDMGNLGYCAAAGIVSGDQVMASMGIQFCSYVPPPGLPLTCGDFHCGKFKDEFDWSTLDIEYLNRIGAAKGALMKPKPKANAKLHSDAVL